VAAVLLQKAVGNRFHAIMVWTFLDVRLHLLLSSLLLQVDNGCLRKNEAELVVERLKNSSLNINLTVVPAADRFLDALEGVVDPEVKRKTIGRIFIEIFQEEAKKIGGKVYALSILKTY
jgi:GMP synthase PP-ATPase subunit